MDRRVRERRRQVSRDRGRRRAGLIFVCVFAVAATALFLWLRSSDVFAVQEVSASATRHVTQEQIAEAVAPARGVSLLKVSTGTIEQKLAALPYVRGIRVHRSFPHRLEIHVEEYEALARVRAADGETWLVADDGRILEKARSQAEAAQLPLVVPGTGFTGRTGGSAPRPVLSALPVVLLLRSVESGSPLPPLEQISVSADGAVAVRLEGGTELRLGEPTDLKRKITAAVEIFEEYLRDGKSLQYVDASAAPRVAVKAD